MLVTQVGLLRVERNVSSGEAAFSYGQGDPATVLSPVCWISFMSDEVTKNDDLEDGVPGTKMFKE